MTESKQCWVFLDVMSQLVMTGCRCDSLVSKVIHNALVTVLHQSICMIYL